MAKRLAQGSFLAADLIGGRPKEQKCRKDCRDRRYCESDASQQGGLPNECRVAAEAEKSARNQISGCARLDTNPLGHTHRYLCDKRKQRSATCKADTCKSDQREASLGPERVKLVKAWKGQPRDWAEKRERKGRAKSDRGPAVPSACRPKQPDRSARGL